MIYLKRSNQEKKRNVCVFLLLVFALSAFLGPIAHAYIGEDFDTFGHGDRVALSERLHDKSHDHEHDEDWLKSTDQQHKHDHDPADHSHEVLGLTNHPVDTQTSGLNGAYLAFAKQSTDFSAFKIERPPRP